MVRYNCMPVLISTLFVVVISVNGRPAESNIDNDLGDKNGVQMYDRKDHHHSTRTAVVSSRQYSASSLANVVPHLSRPPASSDSTTASLDRDVRFAPPSPSPHYPRSWRMTIDERKLSKNETPTDVECKSESKPLFFKASVNRLRSEENAQQKTTATPKPNKDIECRSESKVLNVRNRDLSGDAAAAPQSLRSHPKRFSKRDSPGDPRTSVPYQSPSVFYDDIPIGRDFDDTIQRHFVPAVYVLSAYPPPASWPGAYFANGPTPKAIDYQANSLIDERIPIPTPTTTTTTNNRQEAYLFFRLNPSRVPQPALSSAAPIATVVDDAINEAAVDRANVSEPNATTFDHRSLAAQKASDSGKRRRNDQRTDPPPVTSKIILRPLAKAKAGQNGVAISSPVSTAYVKRGDLVEIEYLPEATADVGEGGVAISRPELVIHFIDRRRK